MYSALTLETRVYSMLPYVARRPYQFAQRPIIDTLDIVWHPQLHSIFSEHLRIFKHEKIILIIYLLQNKSSNNLEWLHGFLRWLPRIQEMPIANLYAVGHYVLCSRFKRLPLDMSMHDMRLCSMHQMQEVATATSVKVSHFIPCAP